MLVHISPGRHRVTVISIPRDTMVPMYQCESGPGYTGQQADPNSDVIINSLLQIGGPTCLWKTVEQVTGIRIDHFIGIGMLGFVKVVDDLGGVNVCVPYNVDDPVSGLDLKAGEQHINGIQALAFWRTREDLGTGSDLERIERDQFMSAQWSRRAAQRPAANPIKMVSVVTDAAASMTTDSGMTVSDLVQIGESFRNLSGQNVQFITVPNEPWTQNPDRFQFLQPQASQVFAAIARDITVPMSPPPGASRPRAGPDHQPGRRQGRGAERFRRLARRQRGGRRADQPRLRRDRYRRRPEFRLHQLGHRVLFGRRHGLVNTLKKELTDVTSLRVASLTPGTVDLIRDPTSPASPSPVTQVTPQASATPSSRRRRPGEPVRFSVLLRRGQPGPVQRRHHRRRGLRQRQFGLRPRSVPELIGP